MAARRNQHLTNTNKLKNGNSGTPKDDEVEVQKKLQLSEDIENEIVDCEKIFRGLTLGSWLQEWVIWLHSETPFYTKQRGDVLFTSGNNSFVYDKETGLRKSSQDFHNRARSKKVFRGEVIFTDTPIWVNISSSIYSVGEQYGGKSLDYGGRAFENLQEVRSHCRRETMDSGPLWFTVEKKGIKGSVDLESEKCYVESPSFQLTVPEGSLLRQYFQMPIEPGTYDTVAVAHVVFIKHLSEGHYRFRFGGYGTGDYVGDSVYDLIVQDVEKAQPDLIRPTAIGRYPISDFRPDTKPYELDPL